MSNEAVYQSGGADYLLRFRQTPQPWCGVAIPLILVICQLWLLDTLIPISHTRGKVPCDHS